MVLFELVLTRRMFLGSSNSTPALGLWSTISRRARGILERVRIEGLRSVLAALSVPLPLLWGDRSPLSAESLTQSAKSSCEGLRFDS